MIYKKLNSGCVMPMLGYGTYKIVDDYDAERCVLDALDVGYRKIDTATLYRNEDRIGNALNKSGIKRNELFVTTKLWTNVLTKDDVFKTVDGMLSNLKTDYLDLLLIHWPTKSNIEVWSAMQRLYDSKIVRSIGTSNFKEHHLDEIIAMKEITPSVNQVELHPLFQQEDLRKYCKDKGIQIEAWSPLMRGKVLQDENLIAIAKNHEKTVAEVILRFDLQSDISVIPKTTDKERMKENFDVFDFELSEKEIAVIRGLNQNARQYRDPDNHGF